MNRWCADLQANKQEPLYVDKVHYTASFAQEIAQSIATQLNADNLFELPAVAVAAPDTLAVENP